MSKFIDRLKQLSTGAPQPIGFRLGMKTPSKLKIQLIGRLEKMSPEINPDVLEVADATILRSAKEITQEEFAQSAIATSTRPFGTNVPVHVTVDIDQVIKAGADFAVFPVEMPLTVIPEKGIGKVLEVDASIGDGLLRALNALPVDAFLIAPDAKTESLDWQDLLLLQRVAGVISKPVIAAVPAGITSGELGMLWSAGIDGVVVDITDVTAEKFKGIRQAIDKLEPPDTTRRDRSAPSVPRISSRPEHQEDEEEEEEEEYE